MSLVLAALRDHAERPALVGGHGSLSYRQLSEAVVEAAAWLGNQGCRTLATALDNGPGWVVWDLAALLAGCTHVPLPAFFSAAQHRHVLASAGVDLLIATASAPGGRRVRVAGEEYLWQHPAVAARHHPGVAKITYTSGTTGTPKGVCLNQPQLEAVAGAVAETLAGLELQRHLCALPLSTLLENVAGVYTALLLGATIHLPGLAQLGYSGASGLDPRRWLASLHAAQPHSLILVPQLLGALVDAGEAALAPPRSLRFIAVGGARVAPELLQRAAALGLPVYEGYGLSECASVVCLNRPGARRPGSAGQPLPHAQVRIGPGGEVEVRGPRMLGYLDGPAPAGAWFATGDLGRLDEQGFLHIGGRRRNVFITAYGRNVCPEWVESELTAEPAIAHAVVYGEARPWNAAVLLARPGAGAAAVRAAVGRANARLPDYARLGGWVLSGSLAGLLTTNGRPRRAAIAARYASDLERLYRERTDDELLQTVVD